MTNEKELYITAKELVGLLDSIKVVRQTAMSSQLSKELAEAKLKELERLEKSIENRYVRINLLNGYLKKPMVDIHNLYEYCQEVCQSEMPLN